MKSPRNITDIEIRTLYEKYRTPAHVQRHMRCVARLAVQIAQAMKKNATPTQKKVDVAFVRSLALLHDLLKPLVFESYKGFSKNDQRVWKTLRARHKKENDTDIASRILKKMGYISLANAIRSQTFDAPISRIHPLKTIEEKIVYYADKRIAHDKKVSLRIRLDEGYKRYLGKTPTKKSKRLIAIERKIFALEKELLRYTCARINA